jgi:cytochrome b subunit of formate dehydrogenase
MIPAAGKLSYAVVCAAGLVLAATGLGTFALGQAPMTHWVLMAHVAAAPMFALGLAALALTWSGLARGGTEPPLSGPAKFLLWVVLLAGLVVTLSGVLPMTPLLGTPGQHLLYLTHRYSAMVLTVAVLFHLPLLARRKGRG